MAAPSIPPGPGLHLSDARSLTTLLRPLKRRFSTIITSPPYADLQDYHVDTQIGFGQSMSDYLGDLRSVFESCAEISTDQATMWLVVGAIRRGGEVVLLPDLVANEAHKAGWRVREAVT